MLSLSSLSEYIYTYYDVMNTPALPLEDCNIFLLAETHFNAKIRALNGEFISKYAPCGSIFLVEGEPSCKSLNEKTFYCSRFHIASENIADVLGWDIEDYLTLLEAPLTARILAMQVHDSHPPDASIEWETEIAERFDAQSCILPEKIPFVKKCITGFANRLKYFDEESFALGPTFTVKRSEYRKQIINDFPPLLELFPKRTDSMIKTLEKVSPLASGKIFLIAGIKHLLEKALEGLLSKRPDIVILKPKLV